MLQMLQKTPEIRALAKNTYETTIRVGGRAAPMTIRVNARARRILLRIDPVEARIIATAPSVRSVPEAVAFARSKSVWLAGELGRAVGPKAFSPGAVFPLRGAPRRIINEGGPRAPVREGPGARVFVGGAPAHVSRRLTDWLKREARCELTARTDFYAARLGVKRGPVRIRDTRSRWGSCSAEGVLSFSWRLILAPQAILDYVAAHECAHLVHLNHSPAYWRLLASLGVDARAAKTWFDAHGPGLFAWGAGNWGAGDCGPGVSD